MAMDVNILVFLLTPMPALKRDQIKENPGGFQKISLLSQLLLIKPPSYDHSDKDTVN